MNLLTKLDTIDHTLVVNELKTDGKGRWTCSFFPMDDRPIYKNLTVAVDDPRFELALRQPRTLVKVKITIRRPNFLLRWWESFMDLLFDDNTGTRYPLKA